MNTVCSITILLPPRIAALHHPAVCQEHEAFLGLREFHDFALATMGHRLCSGLGSRGVLIANGQFDRGAVGVLPLDHQLRHL